MTILSILYFEFLYCSITWWSFMQTNFHIEINISLWALCNINCCCHHCFDTLENCNFNLNKIFAWLLASLLHIIANCYKCFFTFWLLLFFHSHLADKFCCLSLCVCVDYSYYPCHHLRKIALRIQTFLLFFSSQFLFLNFSGWINRWKLQANN